LLLVVYQQTSLQLDYNKYKIVLCIILEFHKDFIFKKENVENKSCGYRTDISSLLLTWNFQLIMSNINMRLALINNNELDIYYYYYY